MVPDSRQTVHMGVNYLLSPMPTINMNSHLRFQQSLVEGGED